MTSKGAPSAELSGHVAWANEIMRGKYPESTRTELAPPPIEPLTALGCATSQRALVGWLTPVIRARVKRVLARQRTAGGRLAFASVDDLVQDVFTALFADEMRVLLQWDRQRGLSLKNYVGLVAERLVARSLRARASDPPFVDTQAMARSFDELPDSRPGPEGLVALREHVCHVATDARARLSDEGYRLFELLLLQDRPIDEVCRRTGLARSAVYVWRCRLLKLIRRRA